MSDNYLTTITYPTESIGDAGRTGSRLGRLCVLRSFVLTALFFAIDHRCKYINDSIHESPMTAIRAYCKYPSTMLAYS